MTFGETHDEKIGSAGAARKDIWWETELKSLSKEEKKKLEPAGFYTFGQKSITDNQVNEKTSIPLLLPLCVLDRRQR